MAYRWLSVTTILAEVPGLDVHKLAYYRRERYLVWRGQHRNGNGPLTYKYREDSLLLLKLAFPKIQEGMRVRIAFEQAKQELDALTSGGKQEEFDF